MIRLQLPIDHLDCKKEKRINKQIRTNCFCNQLNLYPFEK